MGKIILKTNNLSYRVGKKYILKDVNLRVYNNEIHTLVGTNGTGKTTLAFIIMGLSGYMPSTGEIIFNGKNITSLSITERAKLGITLAWQNPALFEGITVRDYLNLNKGSIPPEKSIEMVGLNPHIYLSRVVDSSLSGGERKRIELASVISIYPRLAILDEPDSGIDMISIEDIKRIILGLKELGSSVILITHREEIADIGDTASLICRGEILKVGKPEEVSIFFKKNCERCNHVGEYNKELLK